MKKLLFLITSDPRSSPRPAEAIRIAAGVGVWKKVTTTVYLRGPAVLALSEFAEELVDGENFTRYLPILQEFEEPLYFQRGAQLPSNAQLVRLEAIDDAQLAALAGKSNCVLRF